MEKQSVNDYIQFEATSDSFELEESRVAIWWKVRKSCRSKKHALWHYAYKTILGSTYITNINIEPDEDKSRTNTSVRCQ